MRFLPTSSIDVIEAPTPFVRATEWSQFRSQFRTRSSQKAGYRNSLAASEALNPGSLNWDRVGGELQADLGSRPFEIVLQAEPDMLETAAVDECFALESIDQLIGKESRGAEVQFGLPETCPELLVETGENSYEFCYERPSEVASGTDDLDMELGLLESVQELAISLARMSPVRTNTPASS